MRGAMRERHDARRVRAWRVRDERRCACLCAQRERSARISRHFHTRVYYAITPLRYAIATLTTPATRRYFFFAYAFTSPREITMLLDALLYCLC